MNHQDIDNAANFEERNTFPGYPIYPPTQEIIQHDFMEDDTDPEDFFKWKEPNWATGEWRTVSIGSGSHFDSPNSEISDYHTRPEDNFM